MDSWPSILLCTESVKLRLQQVFAHFEAVDPTAVKEGPMHNPLKQEYAVFN